MSYGLKGELENYAEKHSAQLSIDRSNLILDRSSQTELHNEFYNSSIPTLHKRPIL